MTDAASRGAPVRIRRALLSVSDKTGLVEQAQKLAAMGVELRCRGRVQHQTLGSQADRPGFPYLVVT